MFTNEYTRNVVRLKFKNLRIQNEKITMNDWFGWHLDLEALTLDFYPPHWTSTDGEPLYWIEICDLKSSASILDWVAQLSHKNENVYGKAPHLGLFNAIDLIFNLQANCCSDGKEKTFDPIKLAKMFCDENNIRFIEND